MAAAVSAGPETGGLLRPDGSVVIPAAAAHEVLRALVRDLTARARADGGEVSPGARRLLYALHEAANRAEREASSAAGTPTPGSGTVELTAEQAALLLGCSTEYVRRLARTGRVLARRAGPAWLIDPASLDAYRKGQQTP
ncbi:helix-turn-helix domain-containing protein [Streptomyces virginiae]|uniref:helix-turn-helix domain-containing protein n=1 Tax=Streptomyces virginiae TaxID=1961 RepID=UPI00352FEDCD